jgi:hypothetical protein
MRNTRCSCVATAGFRGVFQVPGGNLPDALPAVPNTLGNQRPVGWSLEIRALPALLSPGTDHLERTLLSSAALDHPAAEIGCDSVSVRFVPMQLRELPALQGEVFVAEDGAIRGAKDGNASPQVTAEFSAVVQQSSYPITDAHLTELCRRSPVPCSGLATAVGSVTNS